MRIVGETTEDDMIAVFLRGELASPRFGSRVAEALDRSGAPRELVEHPDLGDAEANAVRRAILTETRGYDTRIGLFGGFPADVVWQRVALTPGQLGRIRYIDYDYWVELSGGTRSPVDAARRIAEGIDVFGVPSADFLAAARTFDPLASAAEPIVVTAGGGAPLVVLEGHVRLTLYALRPELVRPDTQVLLGTSPRMTGWALY